MHVLIVDDEQKARETIKEVIKLYCPQVTSIKEADSVKSALALINKQRPDLILLDIRLNDGNGFDILDQINANSIFTIFITAYNEYAIKAFKVAALDYLLKPIDTDEFALSIERAYSKINALKSHERMDAFIQNMKAGELKKITLKTNESIHIVNINDIIYCEADKNYTTFYLIENKKILISKPIGEYEELLSGTGFMRIHQSFLINLSNIKRYEKGDGGSVITIENHKVPVSTRKKDQLMQFLQKL